MRLLGRSVLFASLLGVVLTQPSTAQQGQAAFEQTTHDFGPIVMGEQPSHVFTFRNTGADSVRLLMVRPTCGCTSPEWTRDPVPPGGTGWITVVYNSEDRPGSFRKNINVFTDGQPEELVLYITGRVTPKPVTGIAQGSLVFENETADLGSLAAGESGTYTFRLQNNGSRPVQIKNIEAAQDLSISYPGQPMDAGEVVEITVVVNGKGGAGTAFAYPILLNTDDEAVPVKSLRVTGTGK